MKNKFCIIIVSAVTVLLLSFCVSCSISNSSKNETNNYLEIQTNSVNPKGVDYQEAEIARLNELNRIENLVVFAEPTEFRFKYAYAGFQSEINVDCESVKKSICLVMANVSGKAIKVDDVSAFIPNLSVIPNDDPNVAINGTEHRINREFNDYSGEQVYTGIWMDKEAICIDYDFIIPKELAEKDFKLIVSFNGTETVIADSLSGKQNNQSSNSLTSSNVDIYYQALETNAFRGDMMSLLIVNRDSSQLVFTPIFSVELSCENEGVKSVVSGGTLTNWTPVSISKNEANSVICYIGSSGSNLKTGLYTLSVKFNEETVASFQYLVISENSVGLLRKAQQ